MLAAQRLGRDFMGKIVAVWSDVKKSGKSVVTYMLANRIRETAEKGLKILVCCLNLKYSSLYSLFGVSVSATGLEDLINYQFFKTSNKAIIPDITPESSGICFLGSYRTTNSYINKNIENYSKLIDELKENFDLIIFDTISGNENQLTDLALRRADIILRLFVQDNESLKVLANPKCSKMFYNQEIINVISKYRNIYPRLSDIKRIYAINNFYRMDYCDILQEMKNRESLNLYIQRETACNSTIIEISKYILDKLCLTAKKEPIKEKHRSYIRSLLGAYQRR